MYRNTIRLFVFFALGLLVACGGSTPPPEPTPDTAVSPTSVPAVNSEPTSTPLNTAVSPTALPSPELEPEATSPSVAERLSRAFSTPVEPLGEVLILGGQVLDVAGNPLANTAVENA